MRPFGFYGVGLIMVISSAAYAADKPYLDIRELTTDKGVHVWYVHDAAIPVVSIKFAFQGGARLDAKGKEGSGELLSTLLDEGAGKRNAEQFQEALDAHGIRIGFSAGRDAFYGSMKTTLRHQDMAFSLLRDALNAPHFNHEAVMRMKDALQSQLRFQAMNPQHKASQTLMSVLFADTDYARPVEGTAQSLQTISVDDIRALRARLMCRNHVKIAVVGQVEPKTLSMAIDGVFGDLPVCSDDASVEPITARHDGKQVNVAWNGAQNVVLMAQDGIARQHKDWWAARILDFALGGGQFSSRLMDEVRVKRGLTYGIYSSLTPYDRAALWIVQASVDTQKTDEAVRVTRDIWAQVARDGLRDDEIAAAKAYLIGSLPLALTSTDRMASIVLQLQEDGLAKDTLDVRAAEISAVTADDIRRVARDILTPEKMTTIIVGPAISKDKKKQ